MLSFRQDEQKKRQRLELVAEQLKEVSNVRSGVKIVGLVGAQLEQRPLRAVWLQNLFLFAEAAYAQPQLPSSQLQGMALAQLLRSQQEEPPP